MHHKAFVSKPLSLEDHKKEIELNVSCLSLKKSEEPIGCLMCDELFELGSQQKQLLSHLLSVHRIVISDFNLIGDARK